jgi:hypothetical protein
MLRGSVPTLWAWLMWRLQLSRPTCRSRRSGVAWPPTLVLSWLPAYIGYKRALELVTTGRAIDAATACSYGLVNRVVPPEELPATIEGVLATWREFDPIVLRDIKQFTVNTRYWPPDRAAGFGIPAPRQPAGGLVAPSARRSPQPFTAPAVRPEMIRRWKRSTSTTSGRVITIEAAVI